MKDLSSSDFICLQRAALWNDEDVVFVKCDKVSNSDVWRLFTSDGTELAVTDSRDLAFIVARQRDFIPLSVH